MGFDPLTLALAAGGLSAVSSIASAGRAGREAEYQAQAAEAGAQAARNQAKITAEKGRIEAENLDRERSALTRAYADMQAGNAAAFGALGVDMSSGSAADVFAGNAARYASDLALNSYQKKVTEWETRQNVNASLTNAANYDAQAGYYKSTVQGLGSTLLTAGLSGLSSGLGVYSMAGGFGGSEGLFGSLGTKGKNISNMSRVKGKVGA